VLFGCLKVYIKMKEEGERGRREREERGGRRILRGI